VKLLHETAFAGSEAEAHEEFEEDECGQFDEGDVAEQPEESAHQVHVEPVVELGAVHESAELDHGTVDQLHPFRAE